MHVMKRVFLIWRSWTFGLCLAILELVVHFMNKYSVYYYVVIVIMYVHGNKTYIHKVVFSLKAKDCQFDSIVITGGTVRCRNGKLRCQFVKLIILCFQC